MAEQVRQARVRGVDAFGWLPSDHGSGVLAEYANGQGASTIVVPRDLAELDGLEALLNGTARPAEELEQQATAELVVV